MRPIDISRYLASGYIAVLTVAYGALAACLMLLVRGYQGVFGAMMGGHCRFQPTCSEYALDAIRNCGPLKGLRLSIWRVLRCHPFSKGGLDPAPEAPGEEHGGPEGSA